MNLSSFNKLYLVGAISLAVSSSAQAISDVQPSRIFVDKKSLSKATLLSNSTSKNNEKLALLKELTGDKKAELLGFSTSSNDDEEYDECEEEAECEFDDEGEDDDEEHGECDEELECENDGEEDNEEGDEDNIDDPTPPHHDHCMMIPEFADDNLVTHTAAQSGPWTDPETWGDDVPNNAAVVLIPNGIEVVLDDVINARLETVRIDGSLVFATEQNTELRVDTLFSSCSGSLQIGSETDPIDDDVTARVVFIDDGPITDSKLLGRGAVLMGKTTIFGTPKTHRAIISPQAQQGDLVLNLNVEPMGWQIGDELIITGTTAGDPRSDEIRTVDAINGQQIELNMPLEHDHTAPKSSLNVYVANATRNVEFISENTEISRRGHVMFMHTQNVDVQNARFTELGRTDKTRPLDDFQFIFPDDSAGDDAPASAEVIALGGANVRGRYAVHFHQTGTDPTTEPGLIKGAVVFNGPGWGYVIHSSYANLLDNVSYGLQGAGFYTEAGDEIGNIEGNIAIRSVNDTFEFGDQGAIDPDLLAEFMDYGHDGDGFWLTGTRVSLINNVSAGATAHGFIYWTDGIMEAKTPTTTRVTIPVQSLPNADLIPDRQSIPVWWAPLAESRGNESYGATIGFRSRYIHAKNYLGREEQSDFHRSPPQAYIDTLKPTFYDITVWGSRDGILLNYNERLSLDGATIVGFGKDKSVFELNPGTAKEGIGLDFANEATHGPASAKNIKIEGFGMGVATPLNGQWEMKNISLNENATDILILEPENDQIQVTFNNVQFSTTANEDGQTSDIPDHIIIND